MYEARFTEPQTLGLHRLTGDNSGEVYTNERTEQVTDPETGTERTEYVYDVYQVADARDPHKVKNDVINAEHPFGDEPKILRKALAKVLKAMNLYDYPDFAEFRTYNDFAESI